MFTEKSFYARIYGLEVCVGNTLLFSFFTLSFCFRARIVIANVVFEKEEYQVQENQKHSFSLRGTFNITLWNS